MKKLQYIIIGIILICGNACSECLDCGCDDCEDSSSGNLELVRDWSGLWQNVQKPEKTEVYLYHPTLAPWHRTIYTDTSYHTVPAGDYQVLIVNTKSEAVLFQGMDNYYTAEICLPTRNLDSVLVVDEAPLTMTDKTTVKVSSDGPVKCIVSPSPFVKIVNFQVYINRHGDVKEVTECNARLNGVLTSVKLWTEQNEWFSASLDFIMKKETTNVFSKTITLLGMNPQINHKLELMLLDDNGTLKDFEFDVSGKLDFTKGPILNCTIEINLTGTEADINIMDWQTGNIGDIVLQ